MRIGVYGGTFDPVHVGHLVVAVDVRHAMALDRMLLVVAHDPWQKSDRVVARAEDRFAMVEAAVAGHEGLEASRIEVDRAGPSYTADTLEALHVEAPDAELFVVVGADVAADLDTWNRPEVVRAHATLVVVNRGGAPDPTLPPGWRAERVRIPDLEISSSDVRRRLAAGRPVDFLVPAPAVHLLRERALYPGCG